LNVTALEALPIDYQKFKEAICSLSRLLLQRRLFPKTHPSAERALSDAFVRIDALLSKRSSIHLTIDGNRIYYLNFEIDVLETKDSAVHLFRETLRKLSIGEIVISNGISKGEISTFVEILEKLSKRASSQTSQEDWFRMDHIVIRGVKDGASSQRVSSAEAVESEGLCNVGIGSSHWDTCDKNMRKVVSDILLRLEKIQSAEGRSASRRVLELFDTVGRNTSIVLLIKSLRDYDCYTFFHSVNVAVISTAISKKLGLSAEEVDMIGIAAMLHDIGKLYVPREILFKKGRLSPAEWIAVKQHPIHGEKILRDEGIDSFCRAVAYEHHMRFDLTGYPTPKRGYKMVDASHIIRIADSYDALTTKRPYRKQLNPYEAVKLMIKMRGTEFHPDYLDVFMRVLGNIPIGSLLDLDTGESVIVVEPGRESGELPRVRVLKDSGGRDVTEEIILDLNEVDPKTGKHKRHILDVSEAAIRDIQVGKYLIDSE
jgi:putative nucleotidyltransferase with HDIG domain